MTGNLTLVGDEINISGNISGTGNLTIQPLTSSQSILISGSDSGSNGTLDVTSSKLSRIQDGFTNINIDGENGNGTITVAGETTFNAPVIIRSPSGSIIVNNPIIGDSVTLQGTTALNANITTANQDIVINGNTTLGNPVTLNTGTEGEIYSLMVQ